VGLPSVPENASQSAERNCNEAWEARRTSVNLPLPHIFFISPRTIEPQALQYLEAWIKKVTEYGNRNYPLEAKGKLYGNVLLYIEIKSDGNLECAQIERSSGHKVLDDAVLRIVRMAAPYDRFPEALERKADIVAIARAFVFAKTDKKEPE
jgi:protein TonB